MRAAIIRNGIVENLIVAGPDFAPEGVLIVPIENNPVEIGATWDGKIFTNPEPELEPELIVEVSKRDKLLEAGFTEAQVEAILSLDG